MGQRETKIRWNENNGTKIEIEGKGKNDGTSSVWMHSEYWEREREGEGERKAKESLCPKALALLEAKKQFEKFHSGHKS